MPPGGARKGAGKPKGTKHKKTLEKLAEEALVRELVSESIVPMTRAQIAAATGYKHLVARDKAGGKFKSITPEEVERLNDPSMVAEIWEKHPSPEAYKHLLDRAYGRPSERMDVKHEVGPRLELILAGLKRADGNS